MSATRFELDPADVVFSAESGSSGRRKARLPGSDSLTDLGCTLIHRPTGVSVEGRVPRGRYTRQEMRRLRDRLYQELCQELTREVAKTLRLPGAERLRGRVRPARGNARAGPRVQVIRRCLCVR